jgi:hypothetical protein
MLCRYLRLCCDQHDLLFIEVRVLSLGRTISIMWSLSIAYHISWCITLWRSIVCCFVDFFVFLSPGDPFINGQAVPYDPKYHEEWLRIPRYMNCTMPRPRPLIVGHRVRRDRQTKPPLPHAQNNADGGGYP